MKTTALRGWRAASMVALLGLSGVVQAQVGKWAAPVQRTGWGQPLAGPQLQAYRGGAAVHNDMTLSGQVSDNTAVQVSSGSNLIGVGAFAQASGLPTVIQNSGSNVLIQNATIINVQYQ